MTRSGIEVAAVGDNCERRIEGGAEDAAVFEWDKWVVVAVNDGKLRACLADVREIERFREEALNFGILGGLARTGDEDGTFDFRLCVRLECAQNRRHSQAVADQIDFVVGVLEDVARYFGNPLFAIGIVGVGHR